MNNNIPYDMPSQASNDTNGESSPHNEVHTFTVTLPVIQGPPIVLGHPGNTAAAQSTVSNRMFPGPLCNAESTPHNEVHPFTVAMPAIQGAPIVLGHPGNAAVAQSTVPNRMPSQASNDTNGESSPHNEVHPFTVTLPAIQGSPIMLGHFGNAAAAQSTVSNRMAEGEEIPPPKPDFSAPPPYEVATKLPSYEEVQREKTLQGEPHPQIHMPGNLRTPQQPLTILAIDTEAAEGDPESGLLGTDFMFFTAFLVAFLFNWIGFLLLMCFCHTIASRYGALSGFGLSLTKWTLIVKHSTDLASRENSWLWWLIMAFGVLICMRAIIQYLNIKRGWRLLSGSAQERLLFFY